MLIDVLDRPKPERVFKWDGTADDAAAIRQHIDEVGTSVGVQTRFLDHGDGTATVESDTYMYGTPRYPVEAERWYRIRGNRGGIEPIPTTPEEIDELYQPYPEFPAVFADTAPDLPGTANEGTFSVEGGG